MKAFAQWFKPIEDIEYDPEELAKGIKVEQEHTPYKAIAKIIAKQHLAEDPKYYTKLEKMHEDEERRIDPKCWEGYRKVGTKMKGGVRVNDCVKVEDEEDHKPRHPGILKRQTSGKLTCSKARALKSKQKNKGNLTAKAAQRYLNYHC